jgi:hypothetical protein
MSLLIDVRWWTVLVIVLAMGCLLGHWIAAPSTPHYDTEPLSLLPVPNAVMLEEIAALRQQQGTVLEGTWLGNTQTNQDDFSTALANYAGVMPEEISLPVMQTENHFHATAQQLETWATDAEYRYDHSLAEKLRHAAHALQEMK